MLTFWISISF